MRQRLDFRKSKKIRRNTKSLKQEKEEVLEKLRVARYCVTTYQNEKEDFWAMVQEGKAKLQRENEKLLAE
jgi:hypothetical protein